jgi:hypothetical protein
LYFALVLMRCCVVGGCRSDADCLSAMRANCELLGVPVPHYFQQWVNLKVKRARVARPHAHPTTVGGGHLLHCSSRGDGMAAATLRRPALDIMCAE